MPSKKNIVNESKMINKLNLEEMRKNFPITKEYTYLDNAGLSPIPVNVIKAITNFFKVRSNTGAMNYYTTWQDILNNAKTLFGKLINADASEIALTKNTSEGINIVANMINWKRGDNIIIDNLEHPNNTFAWMRQKRHGVEVRVVKHKQGMIDISDIEKIIDKNTKVIAVCHVSYLNGFKYDLKELGKLTKEKGIYLVVDSIQSVGVLQINVKDFHVDFLSCGGHKWLLAPLGTGFFYCRKELISEFEPLYVGQLGHTQMRNPNFSPQEWHPANTARRFMTGNINLAGFAGAKTGLEYIHSIGIQNIEKRVLQLTDLVIKLFEDSNVSFLSPLEKKYRSEIINFKVPNINKVLNKLEEEKIIVAPRMGGLRISPNFYNTEDEIEKLCEIVSKSMIGVNRYE